MRRASSFEDGHLDGRRDPLAPRELGERGARVAAARGAVVVVVRAVTRNVVVVVVVVVRARARAEPAAARPAAVVAAAEVRRERLDALALRRADRLGGRADLLDAGGSGAAVTHRSC